MRASFRRRLYEWQRNVLAMSNALSDASERWQALALCGLWSPPRPMVGRRPCGYLCDGFATPCPEPVALPLLLCQKHFHRAVVSSVTPPASLLPVPPTPQETNPNAQETVMHTYSPDAHARMRPFVHAFLVDAGIYNAIVTPLQFDGPDTVQSNLTIASRFDTRATKHVHQKGHYTLRLQSATDEAQYFDPRVWGCSCESIGNFHDDAKLIAMYYDMYEYYDPQEHELVWDADAIPKHFCLSLCVLVAALLERFGYRDPELVVNALGQWLLQWWAEDRRNGWTNRPEAGTHRSVVPPGSGIRACATGDSHLADSIPIE